jgi:ubiquinone/menaquinone biosynthesis C-methylase UbiE
MAAESVPVEEQIMATLCHLGVARAHIVANLQQDYRPLLQCYPTAVASLTLVCPRGMHQVIVDEITCPLLVVSGENGPVHRVLMAHLAQRPATRVLQLHGYEYMIWSDVAADCQESICGTLEDFFASVEHTDPNGSLARLGPRVEEGQVGDVAYAMRGEGTPVVLLPLQIAPTQWDALIPPLSERFCTITLTGKAVGYIAVLEARGRSGYMEAVSNWLGRVAVPARAHVLEVGCGSGVLMRWLAQQTDQTVKISGVDLNRYFVREAAKMAEQAGLAHRLDFRVENAEQLPFPDNFFDVVYSSTVLEEVNVTLALAEIVRVTKPGGRVAILVRSLDMYRFIHLPLPAELKRRLEAPAAWGPGVAKAGCADATLYTRMEGAGLLHVRRLPQVASFAGADALAALEGNIFPLLNAEELVAWQRAAVVAAREGDFFYLNPYHSAIGTKP